MVKKMSIWKTKGMNRDLSVSAFNAEFAFENLNLRLSTNENNTLMSWVTEKGTLLIGGQDNFNYWNLEIDPTPWQALISDYDHVVKGIPVGTAVINHQLVLFTTQTVSNVQTDRIYVLWYSNAAKTKMEGKKIFEGFLNFNVQYPLETLVSYEAEHVQKVYWTDGFNQPRIINIAASTEKLATWHNVASSGSQFTLFDFVPAVNGNETMTIIKDNSGGFFAPGVIQYCFTYINKYGQQSNIIDVSPLYYLSFEDRGGSPEEKCNNCFHIRIDGVDSSFDNIRLYAIQRTSLDTEPYIRLLSDLEIQAENLGTVQNPNWNYYVTYIDNGTTGSSMDPTELLYVGGREITALTMTDKDQTLFLGNLEQKNANLSVMQQYYADQRDASIDLGIEFKQDAFSAVTQVKQLVTETGFGSVYAHTQQLNESQRKITTFKGGETYRLGFQLQKVNGEWSEPIFLDDLVNSYYPLSDNNYTTASSATRRTQLAYAEGIVDLNPFISATASGTGDPNPYYVENIKSVYKKIRPVIVYPNIQDRTVLCQGVLNPTVFNYEDRKDNTPFAQASWYFRPFNPDSLSGIVSNTTLEYTHYSPIRDNEIQGYSAYVDVHGDALSPIIGTGSNNTLCNNTFYIDQSIVTLNSPDIEFDTQVQGFGNNGLKLRVVGVVPVTANTSSHEITALSGMLELGHNNTSTDYPPSTIGTVPYIAQRGANITVFGSGEQKTIVENVNTSFSGGAHLAAEYLWNDAFVMKLNSAGASEPTDVKTSFAAYDYMIYPWHRSGSLNNDFRPKETASSWIMTKKESNSLYSSITEYLSSTNFVDYPYISSKFVLTQNAQVVNYKLGKQRLSINILDSSSVLEDVNYYPNIDKVLYNGYGYKVNVKQYYNDYTGAETDADNKEVNSPVSMKYKSTSHAVIAMRAPTEEEDENNKDWIPMLPYVTYTDNDSTVNLGLYSDSDTDTFWGKTMKFEYGTTGDHPHHRSVNIGGSNLTKGRCVLLLGELYRDNVQNRFGGDELEELSNCTWVPAGGAVEIPWGDGADDNKATIRWTDGDTYFQRYDCLKTYAFTEDDPNQIVEMLSFMCETHINLDGRYDKQRGQKDMYDANPSFFNLMNDAYSQKNNFFSYKDIDHDEQETDRFPNMVYFTKAKDSGADVDLYTNVTLASTLELDGDKGEITSLQRLNNQLLAFQDTGISQILYNESAQISTTQGVPIELANSGKVQGKRYYSETIGCSNKWSIVTTPSGIYFMDSHNRDIYLFNGQLVNVSSQQGFNTWAKAKIKLPKGNVNSWSPARVYFNNFVSYYDKINQDVLFIDSNSCLAFSEKVGAFTSFYDYGYTPYFCNLEDTGIWIRRDDTNDNSILYKHNAGDYCNFFGVNKSYSMTLVGNPEPQVDKIFTNLEFRATVDGDGTTETSGGQTVFKTPYLPFDSLDAWNEYQHGITTLENKNGHNAMLHDENATASLKRRFRIWRCDIPRDNAQLSSDTGLNISRFKVRPLDRLRNPWVYLKLKKNAATTGTLPRTEIHDVMMTYFT